MSSQIPIGPAIRAWCIGIGSLCILAGHCALQFFEYRERVIYHSANSDALVFGAPFLLAAAAYFLLLSLSFPRPRSLGRTISLAIGVLCAAFLSTAVAFFIASNTYGT